MKRATLIWIALAATALIAVVAGYRFGVSDKRTGVSVPANPAISVFDLSLNDVKGKKESLAQWRGKVLVVNYWATWCFPCKEEMPGFSRLQGKYRDKGVQFVGISIDDADKILEFQKETPVNYPLLIGDMATMKNSSELGNTRQALPFTAVFDRQGKLSAAKLGRYDEADLERVLLDLVSR